MWAPTQSFSTREHSFASSIRSGSGSPATASRARHSAVSMAADDDRPTPRVRSLSIVSRHGRRAWPAGGQLGHRAAHERAPALRALRRGELELVLLAEVERARLDAVAVERLGGDGDAAVDRERQREPVVVVGVLADQVHAARPASPHRVSQDAPA